MIWLDGFDNSVSIQYQLNDPGSSFRKNFHIVILIEANQHLSYNYDCIIKQFYIQGQCQIIMRKLNSFNQMNDDYQIDIFEEIDVLMTNQNKSNHSAKNSKISKQTQYQKYEINRPEFIIGNKRKRQKEEGQSIKSQYRSRKPKKDLTHQQRVALEQDIKNQTQSAQQLRVKYKLNIDSIKRYLLQVKSYGRILDTPEYRLSDRSISVQECIRNLVTKQPFLNQNQIKDMVQQALGIIVSQQGVSKILSQMSFTKKRRMNTNIEGDTEQNKLLRHQYAKIYQNELNQKETLFIDEIGFSQLIERQYGYAPRGEQLIRQKRNLKNEVVTLSVLMGYERLHNWVCIQGPPKPSDIASMINHLDQSYKQWWIVLDNARIHKSDEFRQICCLKNIRILYLPPNSPELNPVQLLFSQIKNVYKSMKYSRISSVKEMVDRTNYCCSRLLGDKFWSYKLQIMHWIEKALNKKKFFSID